MNKTAKETASNEGESQAGKRPHTHAGETGFRFGRRRERPDAELMRVLNTGSNGASFRTPRSVSPPLTE